VCLQSHADIIRHTGATPCTEICPFGLTETAVPVRLGEKQSAFSGSDRSCAARPSYRTRRASPPG
jgi:hypothetical protein